MKNRIATTLIALLTALAAACGGGPDDDVGDDAEQPIPNRECDLRLTKTVDDDHASGTSTYQIVVDNVGGGPCRAPVTVTDSLPPGITYSSTLSQNWSCSTVSTQPDEIECKYSNGSIPANGSPVLQLEVQVGDAACMSSNCAEVRNGGKPGQGGQSAGIDSNLSNNRDCATSNCEEVDECVDPPSDMVGWWTADQTGDDSTGENNHGSLQNGAHYATGQVLESFGFDGDDDHVEVPDDDSLDFGANDQFSIDFWVYPNKPKQDIQTLVDKRERQAAAPKGYAIQLRGETLVVRTQNGSSSATYTSSGSIPQKEWTHVTVTVDLDADQGALYIDGSQDGTFSPSSTGAGDLTNDAPLYFGRNHVGEQHFFGRLDEIEFFDRVLDDDEISSLVEAGPCGKCRVGCFDGVETHQAGLDDDFQNGTDSVSPGAYLQSQHSNLKPFDDPTVNHHVGHQFPDLKPSIEYQHICSAELEIRMRPNDDFLVYNDTIKLIVTDGNGGFVAKWGTRIGNLINGQWDPSNTGAQTFTFDLANLPPSGGNPTNLMPMLDNEGFLTVDVQDDTEIDYARLTVDYDCEACEFDGEDPDLAVDKSLEGDLQIGQSSTYTISVDNVGNGDASPPSEISDEVPNCFEIEGINAPWDQWCTINGQQVDCSYPDPIPAGDSAPDLELEVTPSADCGDRVENCAVVSHPDDDNGSNDESCDQSAVSHEPLEADIALEKKALNGPFQQGSQARWELTVTNDGPADAQGPITVTDDLPTCLQYDSVAPSSWSCSTSGSQVTCTHSGPLASGQSETFELVADVTRECSGEVENCAKAQADSPADPDLSNNESCDATEIGRPSADLSIDKSLSGSITPGATSTYDIVVTNNGPSTAQGPITVTDDLPSCLQFGSAGPSPWSCSTSGSTLTCEHPDPLASGASLDLEVTVRVTDTCGDQVTNCAKVQAASPPDPDTTNNDSCDTSTVQ